MDAGASARAEVPTWVRRLDTISTKSNCTCRRPPLAALRPGLPELSVNSVPVASLAIDSRSCTRSRRPRGRRRPRRPTRAAVGASSRARPRGPGARPRCAADGGSGWPGDDDHGGRRLRDAPADTTRGSDGSASQQPARERGDQRRFTMRSSWFVGAAYDGREAVCPALCQSPGGLRSELNAWRVNLRAGP